MIELKKGGYSKERRREMRKTKKEKIERERGVDSGS